MFIDLDYCCSHVKALVYVCVFVLKLFFVLFSVCDLNRLCSGVVVSGRNIVFCSACDIVHEIRHVSYSRVRLLITLL